MNYIEHIEQALEYIEVNLKTELTLLELAKAAGYSEYHFSRVFKQVTRLTPADYIRKRRLSEIARAVENVNRPISDIAFSYGFNSKENFTRAFKAEHNCLPTEYKSAGNSLKLFDRFQFAVPPFVVTPNILNLNGFSLTVYPNQEDSVPKFWNMYNCKKLSLRLSNGKTTADYGVCHWNKEKMRLDYFIGINTKDADGDTSGTIKLEIPDGLFAVFAPPPSSHFDFVNTVHRTWDYIMNVWIPNSGYQFKGYDYHFESYVETSRTYSEDIFIPITHNTTTP